MDGKLPFPLPDKSDPHYAEKLLLIVDAQLDQAISVYSATCKMGEEVLTDYLDGKLELNGRKLLTELRDELRRRVEQVKKARENMVFLGGGSGGESGKDI